MEIQIEGKYGFAEKLPTWRIRWQWYAWFSNGKILTGYHLYLNLLLLLFFHTPFLFSGWTLAGELMVLSGFCLFIPCWDFLWFALNPAFGWKRYRKESIWWMRTWYGPFPADYWNGLLSSGALAALIPFASSDGPAAVSVSGTLMGWGASVLVTMILPVALLTIVAPYRPLVVYPKK